MAALPAGQNTGRKELTMWEARAEYADGSTVERYFSERPGIEEAEQQYLLECWLLDRHPDCTWYSVNYINE